VQEALWHAIIRKNYGASHFIVGRDHAGCKDARGKDFYGAYDAQTLVGAHAEELGIAMMKYAEVEYVAERDEYMPVDKVRAPQRASAVLRSALVRAHRHGDSNCRFAPLCPPPLCRSPPASRPRPSAAQSSAR